MTPRKDIDSPLKVVIAGGGVAGLEAALAIRELAGKRVMTTLLAPNDEFVYRPMAVREPFARSGAAHYRMASILQAADADQVVDSLKWLDHAASTVHTSGGHALQYDALLLALGARQYPQLPYATTINPDDMDGQLHGLIQDVELGLVRTLAFVIPSGFSWPMPIYELALMTAVRAYGMSQTLAITIVTPEPSPLSVFGQQASGAVAMLLNEHGINVITDADTRVSAPGQLTVDAPGSPQVGGHIGEVTADRVIALPELRGPGVPGIPDRSVHGFVAVDSHGRVRHVDNVFAAGDMTDYPVKQGALAAQQAFAVAQEITGLAGVATTAAPFEPTMHGVLLGGKRPLYLRARLVGGQPVTSEFSTEPLWDAADKIHAPRLTRALAGLGQPGTSVLTLAPTA
jgi:sulfide:quinone oxidoreductase